MTTQPRPDLLAEQHLMQLYKVRQLRLSYLVKVLAEGNSARFASALGYSRSQMEQFLTSTESRTRSIGERAARLIEAKASLPFGWLDSDAPLPAATVRQKGEGAR
jgi:hypothetical protein